MEKSKKYSNTRFGAEVLRDALSVANERAAISKVDLKQGILQVEHEEASWTYDNIDEFLADYRRCGGDARFYFYGNDFSIDVFYYARARTTTVSAKALARADIEAIFDVFEQRRTEGRLPEPPVALDPAVVFIGHGRNQAWRDLKDHLQDKHGVIVEAYETGARAGHTIRDVLEEMVTKSSFAVLVLTGEDEQSDGGLRARQNVIHEAGLFQGRLGFSRAILLLEDGVEEFSNVHGVQYIRFSRGNIKETFGEVLATLRREFQRHSDA